MLKKNILSLAISFTVAFLFSFLSTQISGLSSLLPVILTVIFAVCSAVAEKEYTAISAALLVLVSYLLNKDVIIMYSTLISVTSGIITGQMIKKGMSVMSVTIACAVGVIVLFALYIYAFAMINGFRTFNEMFNMLTLVMEQMMKTVYAIPNDVIAMSMNNFRNLFPSIMIISAATLGYMVVFIIGMILSLFKVKSVKGMGFSKFKADGVTTVVFVVSMIITIFAGYGKVGIIAENVYTILTYVLQICGLSLLDWFLKYVKSMNTVLRIIVLVIVSGIPFASVLLVMAALLDARNNFRRLPE